MNICFQLVKTTFCVVPLTLLLMTILCDVAHAQIQNVQPWDMHRECLIVRNTTQLDLAVAQQRANNQLRSTVILVRVEPNPQSGQLEGIVQNPQSGKAEEVPGVEVGRILEGSFRVITALPPSPQEFAPNALVPYKIKKLGVFTGDLVGFPIGESNFYAAFEKKALAVVIINDNEEGIRRFNPIQVIPSEWEDFVLPAFQAQIAREAEIETGAMAHTTETLKMMISNPNPLIALSAFRQLLRSGVWDEKLFEQLARRDTQMKSMIICLSLLYTPSETAPQVNEAVKAMVNRATTAKELRTICLGVYSAYFSPSLLSQRPGRDRYSLELLKGILQHEQQLDMQGKEKNDIDLMLRWAL